MQTNFFSVNKKILPFAFFGNALEFYEFTIYGIFAPVFAQHFFISNSPVVALIKSWGVFAVAFIMRPVGALLFGFVGDKLGRKTALSLSILFMASATLAIGLLPTYEEAGIFAPISLICLRALQGLSTGGEYNGAAIYLIEKFQHNNPGFIGGIITASCVVGSLIGTMFGGWCKSHDMWRIAFIAGGMFGMCLFFMRFMLTESLVISTKMNSRTNDALMVNTKYIAKFISNILVGGVNGALSYTLFGFSLFYLERYMGHSAASALNINITGMVSFLVFNLVFGYTHDKLGSKIYWPLILAMNACCIAISFSFLTYDNQTLNYLGIILLGAQTGSIAGPCHAFLQEQIDPDIRYRFVSVSFSLGMGVIGGLTPALMTFFIENYQLFYAPCYWVGALAVIALIFIKSTRHLWNT
jgi:MFS transporter, MHS family, proline/betaine transporter